MNDKLGAAKDSMERSIDTKLKPVQGQIVESQGELSKLKQLLNRAEDAFELKLTQATGATKAAFEAQTVAWKNDLETAGAAAAALSQNLRENLLAEFATLSRALQASTSEQQKLNEAQGFKTKEMEEAAYKLDQLVAAHSVRTDAQLSNATDELRQRLDADRTATERQLRELLGELDRRSTAVLQSCQKEVGDRFGDIQQQFTAASDGYRKKLESLKSAVQTELVATQGKIEGLGLAVREAEASLRSEIGSACSSVAAAGAAGIGRSRTEIEALLSSELMPLREGMATLDGRISNTHVTLEERLQDSATTLARQHRDRSEKVELQLEQAEGELKTLSDSAARQHATLQQQILTSVSAQDDRVQKLRLHVEERSDRLEQQSGSSRPCSCKQSLWRIHALQL